MRRMNLLRYSGSPSSSFSEIPTCVGSFFGRAFSHWTGPVEFDFLVPGKMEMFAMNSDDLTHMGWGAWGWIINESWKDVEHWQNIWSVIHWPIRCAGAAGVWTNHQVHQFSTFFDGRAAGRPTTTLQILGRPKRLVSTAPELPGFASSLWLNYRLIGL